MGVRASLAKFILPDDWVVARTNEAVRKQSARRRATLSPAITRMVERHGALPKPYDPIELRDYSGNAVAQAYVDTLVQDAATAKWSLEPIDEQMDVPPERIDAATDRLRNIHPEISFRDMREMAGRDLLQCGDAAWVKHYGEGGDLAEAVPVDSARMFKKVDEYGFTEGYIQTSFTQFDIAVEFSLDEVVWFSWAAGGRENYMYGFGPVEKGKPVITLLDELSDKELKDLMEGAPPGIVSARDSLDNPIPPEEFDRVDDQWELHEGERHRHIISRGEWDFVPLSPGYTELQLLERSKFWVQVLGSVFKVNSAYAGFDPDNVNRSTHESESEAFKQRGFRVLLRYLEESINKQLMPEIDPVLRFRHVETRTIEDQKVEAEMMERQASAGKALVDAGLTVAYRDGELVVEDGEMGAGTSEGGGGLAGLFGGGPMGGGGAPGNGAPGNSQPDTSTNGNGNGQDLNLQDMTLRFKGDDPSVTLTSEEAVALDEYLLGAHTAQVVPASIGDIGKRSWAVDEDVPQFVRDAVEAAIDAGAVFGNFAADTIPTEFRDTLSEFLKEKLTQPQGWSLRSMTEDLTEMYPGVPESDLETILRTETASVLNKGREIGYESRPDSATYRYRWRGVSDDRQTPYCAALMEATADGVTLPELKRKARELHAVHFPDLSYRDISASHPNCRSTFLRVVGS